MAFYRSIRNRRNRRSINTSFELQITSLLDILIILLVFLLRTYSVSYHNMSSVPGIEIPTSRSKTQVSDSLYVVITKEAIHFENARVVEFEPSPDLGKETEYKFFRSDLDEGGLRIVPLFNALVEAKEKSELLKQKSQARDIYGNPLEFEGILAIQADKAIEYDTIRKVMYTAGAAGYKVFRLIALKQDE